MQAQAAPSWCCWGLDGHVGTGETLRAASQRAKATNGAPGIAGVAFEALAGSGVEACLAQMQDALVPRTYPPMR